MTKLLIKMFVKDYKNTSDEKIRGRYGIFSGIVGIFTNTLLVSIKIIIGILSSSVALIADAINNLSDAGSALLTIIGFKLSQKEPDEKHPFGHERIEYIISLLIAVLILVIGGNFLITSVKNCFEPKSITFTLVIIIFLGVSVLVKVWQALFYNKIAKIIDSTAIKASSRDSLNDSIITTSVLISAIIWYFFDVNIDAYVGILISLFIVYSGIRTLIESSSPLIGELPKRELVDELISTLLEDEKIRGYHDLTFHSYGPNKLYASIHLEFDYKDDILEIHEIIDELEKKVYEEYKIELVVHMDPVIYDDEEINKYREQIEIMIKAYDENIDIHDFRIVKGPNSKKVLFDCVLPISYYKDKLRIKTILETKVSEMIKGCECIIVLDTKILYE